SGDAALSYAELDAAASRLAGRLAGLGAGPERVVAVLMDRSPLLITALLAAWKAGAAYLPVDTGYPADRIAFMLGDASPAVIVTDEANAALVPPGEVPVLVADEAGEPGDAGEALLVGADLVPSSAAYVMYTSGSTGVPKG